MKITMSGFDDMISKLENMSKSAEELNGKTVPFSELFNDAFMQKNSNFSTLSDFVDASGFDWSSQEAFSLIPTDQLDSFVQTTSSFSSFEEMKQTAGTLYIKNKMGL